MTSPAMKTVKEIAARFEKLNKDRLAFLAAEVRRAMLWIEIVNPGQIGMTHSKDGFGEWQNDLAAAYLEYVTDRNDLYQ